MLNLKIKKFFSLFLAFILTFSFIFGVQITACAEITGDCGTGVTYSLNTVTGVMTVSGTGAMKDYGTTALMRQPWYSYMTNIKTLTIGEGVTSVGRYAFDVASELVSVSFPSTLTSIGNSAFNKCAKLQEITLPDAVTNLGIGAFRDCTGMTKLTLNTGLVSVGSYAFYNCSGLTKITIPDTVTTIESYAFFGINAVNLVIPESVTDINTRSFANCTMLTSVTVNNANTAFNGIIGEDPFNGCNSNLTFYGHKGSTTETYCTEKGYKFVSLDGCEHTETTIVTVVEATCDTDGTNNIVCNECQAIVRTETVPALGHDKQLQTEEDLTETNGHINYIYTCANCGETFVESTHEAWVDGYYTTEVTREATCVSSGLAKDTCTICAESKTRVRVISALGHTYVTDSETPATCTEAGSKTETCSVCGKTVTTEIPALGHSVTDEDYTVTIVPTCLEEGKKVATCSTCGATLEEVLPANGHTFVEDYVDNNADGHIYTHSTCSECGYSTVETVHDSWVEGYYSTNINRAATCSLPGIATNTCTVCGKTTTVSIPKTGHSYVFVKREEPTCASAGTIFYKCSVCSLEKQEKIPALGHTYDESTTVRVEPTCTLNGSVTRTCTVCGYVDEKTLNAIGHIYAYSDCADGVLTYTCVNCSESSQTKTLDEIKTNFKNHFNTKTGQLLFEIYYDLNKDGYINSRDYAMLLQLS